MFDKTFLFNFFWILLVLNLELEIFATYYLKSIPFNIQLYFYNLLLTSFYNFIIHLICRL
jgi:hypothetical protein